MSPRSARVFFVASLLSLSVSRLHAQGIPLPAVGGPAPPTESVVVLRNGEVLRGQVVEERDRYRLQVRGGELSMRRSDVDVVARSLDDAYELKRSKLAAQDVEGRLELAAWCLRQELLGYAAAQLGEALALEPTHPRLALLDRRLQQALSQTTQHSAETASSSPAESNAVSALSNPAIEATQSQSTATRRSAPDYVKVETVAELERMVRALPPDAVEQFTTNLQPLLVNGCATAACHSPGDKSGFTLLRLPRQRSASRRYTQRNLYNVVKLVDFKQPAESRLLEIAREPHGPLNVPAFGEQRSQQYRQLVRWVSELTKTPIEEPPSEIPVATAPPALGNETFSGFATQRTGSNVMPTDQWLDPPGNMQAEQRGLSSAAFNAELPSAAEFETSDNDGWLSRSSQDREPVTAEYTESTLKTGTNRETAFTALAAEAPLNPSWKTVESAFAPLTHRPPVVRPSQGVAPGPTAIPAVNGFTAGNQDPRLPVGAVGPAPKDGNPLQRRKSATKHPDETQLKRRVQTTTPPEKDPYEPAEYNLRFVK